MRKIKPPDWFTSLSFSILVLFISTLIAKAFSFLPFKIVAEGVAFTACMVFIMAALLLAFERKHHQAELDHVLNQLKELIPPHDFPWLYDDAGLAKAEAETKGD